MTNINSELFSLSQVCNTSPTEDHNQDQNVDMENAQDVKDDVNDISNVLQEFKESKIKKAPRSCWLNILFISDISI